MATNTHTEVPHKAPFPPFQKETFASQLVWLAITFVALYLLISRVAVPRIGGIIGWAGASLPLGMVIALTALELLVAFLQAYVFTILTCIYLNDTIHPGH